MLRVFQKEESHKKISFRHKDASKCPICKTTHFKEDLLSGGGRLIAGDLSKELRRFYKPSSKYGTIYPLAYVVQVCPGCLYAAYPKDFAQLSDDEITKIKFSKDHRFKLIQVLLNKVDFQEDRNLISGIASYVLGIDCYFFRSPKLAPIAKMGVSSLRAAWLFDDLFKEVPYRPYDKARDFYYLEASKYYNKTLDNMQTGKEPMDPVSYMLGPDSDHNWGYDGVLYLNSYLMYRNADIASKSVMGKIKNLELAKKYLSKIYGLGKSSKSKPTPIVNMSKYLYDDINKALERLESN